MSFQILDDEISADFYVAVPDILPKLVPLKNKLRKKFPKSKRGKPRVAASGLNHPEHVFCSWYECLRLVNGHDSRRFSLSWQFHCRNTRLDVCWIVHELAATRDRSADGVFSFLRLHPGTVSTNIPKALEMFKMGHEYLVESDCYVRTQIATVRHSKAVRRGSADKQVHKHLMGKKKANTIWAPKGTRRCIPRRIMGNVVICSIQKQSIRNAFTQTNDEKCWAQIN